jgi:hypothetical protein
MDSIIRYKRFTLSEFLNTYNKMGGSNDEIENQESKKIKEQ